MNGEKTLKEECLDLIGRSQDVEMVLIMRKPALGEIKCVLGCRENGANKFWLLHRWMSDDEVFVGAGQNRKLSGKDLNWRDVLSEIDFKKINTVNQPPEDREKFLKYHPEVGRF